MKEAEKKADEEKKQIERKQAKNKKRKREDSDSDDCSEDEVVRKKSPPPRNGKPKKMVCFTKHCCTSRVLQELKPLSQQEKKALDEAVDKLLAEVLNVSWMIHLCRSFLRLSDSMLSKELSEHLQIVYDDVIPVSQR